ncbi:MAG: DUF3327 domain-containing protein [Ardenticatenales bacterium]|nr:DUF3327 domain-containing protein [Ardenticatenales bacterium]
MESTVPLSPRVQRLQDTVERGENDALARFWEELVAQGTPLIEPGDEAGYSLVTFFFRAEEGVRNVAVLQDWGTDGIREHHMELLPGTDVWYKTRRLRSDTRTTYQLSPSASEFREEMGAFRIDPLNPRTYPAYLDDEGGDDIIFSLLELPDAPAQPWQDVSVAAGEVQLHEPLGDGRRAWLYLPPGAGSGPYPFLLTFDGRLYKEIMNLPAILDHLIVAGRIPPIVALLLDNPRRRELVCNDEFATYVAEHLLPWVRASYPVTREAAHTVVTGSSFGGLGAAYLGLRYPELVGNVLSQTGWFRWSPDEDPEFEWLARYVAEQPRQSVRFYLDVGLLENARMADDGPTQLVANRHMRTVLRARGYSVDYVEHSGGHDYSSLEHPLAEALVLMFQAY